MNETILIQQILIDLLIILVAGFVSGIACKRLHVPMVVGHLIVGALIGGGILGLLESMPVVEGAAEEVAPSTLLLEHKILDLFAHLGANLLLFAIGIQFSPSELGKLWKYFLVGGSIQMFGVVAIVTLFFILIGGSWTVGLTLGSAIALSSTVLVFKSLEDQGQATSIHGVRAVAILLFQDVATVPLLVLIGLLTALSAGASGGVDTTTTIRNLLIASTIFVVFVVMLRYIFCKHGVEFLSKLRSVELMVLFTMILLLCVSTVAVRLGLPAALGALAAGVILSETRITRQITAITVPMRETFSAIFFVSLGALFDPSVLFASPVLTVGALLACIVLKTSVAAVAFRILGLPWLPALGMGLGLSQLGELSFVLLSQGVAGGLFDHDTYQRVLFVALTSIILTPFFLTVALRIMPQNQPTPGYLHNEAVLYPEDALPKAIVVGLGPIGGRIVTYLEVSGFDVTLIDMNPVNLHAFAQQGFRTISGDATDDEILRLADLRHTNLVVLTVPDDLIGREVLEAVRQSNPDCIVLVRCRYSINIGSLEQLGANMVACEESETGTAVVRMLGKIL